VPLTISIELLTGSYDAAEVDDRDRAEWPPHPARVFCALVAAARDNDDRAALRWLETQSAPVIVAAAQADEARRSAYVVVNARSAEGGNLTHPGRTNGLRTRTRALPHSPRVALMWAVDGPSEIVRALDAMARRIPYLGRSTGIALVAASTADRPADPDDGTVAFEPCDLLDRELSLRIPYPGFLEELDAQFGSGRPAWEVSRYQAYRQVRAVAEADTPQVPSVYTDLIVFGFSGLKPQSRLAVRFTEALRSAVLRSAGRDAPAVLHGHGANGRPHVAFLALPDVGHRHADGHLLGMAVAVPDLPADERKAVLAAVLGLRRSDHDLVEFVVPGIGGVELIYQPGHVRPWGASPDRWHQGSRRWATATPIVLDRYPKRPQEVEAQVRAGLRRVGLPDPVEIAISTHPVLPGAAPLRPIDLPQQVRGRLFRHVAVTFDRAVHGPVLVGAGRYLGVGLFAPVMADRDA
jgi:CRISPR-associated protein Csb2